MGLQIRRILLPVQSKVNANFAANSEGGCRTTLIISTFPGRHCGSSPISIKCGAASLSTADTEKIVIARIFLFDID